jgi:hypothetical protein
MQGLACPTCSAVSAGALRGWLPWQPSSESGRGFACGRAGAGRQAPEDEGTESQHSRRHECGEERDGSPRRPCGEKDVGDLTGRAFSWKGDGCASISEWDGRGAHRIGLNEAVGSGPRPWEFNRCREAGKRSNRRRSPSRVERSGLLREGFRAGRRGSGSREQPPLVRSLGFQPIGRQETPDPGFGGLFRSHEIAIVGPRRAVTPQRRRALDRRGGGGRGRSGKATRGRLLSRSSSTQTPVRSRTRSTPSPRATAFESSWSRTPAWRCRPRSASSWSSSAKAPT